MSRPLPPAGKWIELGSGERVQFEQLPIFTPEQEARIREIARAEVDIGVAAAPGDTPRLLLVLDILRHELAISQLTGEPSFAALVRLKASALDQANAEHAIDSDCAGELLRATRRRASRESRS